MWHQIIFAVGKTPSRHRKGMIRPHHVGPKLKSSRQTEISIILNSKDRVVWPGRSCEHTVATEDIPATGAVVGVMKDNEVALAATTHCVSVGASTAA